MGKAIGYIKLHAKTETLCYLDLLKHNFFERMQHLD